mmetsp:Transcript_70023/g.138861  ORF Transcript_70023/g.138861 Transcript_70023/m.138861 type:complete len:202 (-) Transcript_70023:138-743(-)
MGEEVTISYCEDLAASVSERAEALRHHGFPPDTRTCDAPLVEWRLPISDLRRGQLEQELTARNAAADREWEVANRAGPPTEARAGALMQCAAQYAKLLQSADGVLGERHEIVVQARQRLATIMMRSRAKRSQSNALPLWRGVLMALRPCFPPHWPGLLEPLEGAALAAEAAGDLSAAEVYRAERNRILAVLRPACDDVAEY